MRNWIEVLEGRTLLSDSYTETMVGPAPSLAEMHERSGLVDNDSAVPASRTSTTARRPSQERRNASNATTGASRLISSDNALIFLPDDRTLVTSTSFPYSAVVHLSVSWNGQSSYICSGAMISAFHVLTAAHCAYNTERGGFVEDITTTPARNGASNPFGSASWSYVRSHGAFNESSLSHDLALVTLACRMGDRTGWFGYESAGSGEYNNLLMSTAGYPSEPSRGRYGDRMYGQVGRVHHASDDRLFTHFDVAGGQSGSPVWRGDGYISGVMSYSSGSEFNVATRINSEKFNSLGRWIDEDARVRPARVCSTDEPSPGPIDDPFEPNNSWSSAFVIGPRKSWSRASSLHSSDDQDFFRFQATRSGTLTIDLSFLHSSGDLELQLLGKHGRLLAGSTGTTDREQIRVRVKKGQILHLRVYGYGSITRGQYTLGFKIK